ncbi:MAG: DNA recombination protein RmuC [Pseudomonadota bacterium]
MNPQALIVVAALGGVLLGALLVWLLLRGRGVEAGQTNQAFARLDQQLAGLSQATPAEMARVREALLAALSQQRQEFGGLLSQTQQGVATQTAGMAQLLGNSFEAFAQQLAQADVRAESLRSALTQHFTELRTAVDTRLAALQAGNEAKLDEMRKTVDEKLHATLEARLGESFKQVSDRLEQVHRGLGEMATLATGVGDLKRVLTNVKTRGGWGEVQLESLLEQTLTAEQFARSVTTRPGSNERVDFAIKLPGRDSAPVWLPLDAKFPREDYERLIDASERGDLVAIETAGKALEVAVKTQAKSIRDKYVEPPHTTDFGLMFLPTEGLYAEVLRRPGLADTLQRDYRITIAGPTTLTALLNSLQMGFKTLAIEKRSSEVWQVLGAVKTEFGKFGEVLDKVKKKLDEASGEIDKTGVRSRAIQRQLREVEAMPAASLEADPFTE